MKRQMRLALGGSLCNMACTYCRSGHNLPRTCEENKTLNKAAIVKEIEQAGEIGRISIWGGEPLLDFPRFKEAVLFLKEALPGVPIGTVCNGTRLNRREIVDFILEEGVELTLSHDAMNHHYRGPDFMDDPVTVEQLKRFDKLVTHTVLHRFNLDLPKIEAFYKKKSEELGVPIIWSFEQFKAVTEESRAFACRGNDFAKLAKAVDYAVRAWADGNMFYSCFQSSLESAGFRFDNPDYKGYRCGMNNSLIVDHTGKRLLCQVMMETGEDVKYGPGELPSYCEDCSIKNICNGYCPLLRDEWRKHNCTYALTFYNQLIATARDLGESLKKQEEAINETGD